MMSMFGDSGDERMAALRQRTRSSDGYSRVSSDDEDNIPSLSMHRLKEIPKNNSGCASCCFVFSLFAVVFLSIVALLLRNNSIYLKVSPDLSDKKQELVKGVVGAIVMYSMCLAISGYFIVTGTRNMDVIKSPQFDD